MKFAFFCHSVISDWNHGNAHFLRGVGGALEDLGHRVDFYEPANGWSLQNLRSESGSNALADFFHAFPRLRVNFYCPETLDPGELLDDTDVVIVHEWNEPRVVARLGDYCSTRSGLRLLFHDTHHRAVTDPAALAAYDLSRYDGVLAFGRVLRDLYLDRGWAERAWIWHEAADTSLFRPQPRVPAEGDLVWIGNWGDGERSAELREYLLGPIRRLRLKARLYGVRYPAEAVAAVKNAGADYSGWLPNYAAPAVFQRYRFTVHIPRRPYTEVLPGIPTIRPFEALASGIPLICSPWDDCEHLFTPGKDFLVAANGREMDEIVTVLLNDRKLAKRLADHGLETILARHTCGHRAKELLSICAELGLPPPVASRQATFVTSPEERPVTPA